ncbi:hypothetical protein [Gemmata obscuriglobus]|uniref:Uncharacterized protein n=1 Tax=Gemmata obscuriglobus TaxID=114 RepID=A0A2Z3H0P0_9BACT|nr:hypothetical protein [Gemmata obscuriglobus]AWM39583.1 hypothetical protein C1280_23025 [Gemmata obscuriglobus]
MPRQNRVTPFGEVIAVPGRGLFMGNRGRLHTASGQIRRGWQLRRWIVCLLEFKGRKRQVMTPGHYTELFFLDEATALAAGHRPCAECRRERFNAFRARALETRGDLPALSAVELDRQLHAQRLTADGKNRTHRARLQDLPDGTFVLLPDAPRTPYLIRSGVLLTWTAGGYTSRIPQPSAETVEVLTPELTVGAFRHGYVPELHPSAN